MTKEKAIEIAKQFHLELEVEERRRIGNSPEEDLYEWDQVVEL